MQSSFGNDPFVIKKTIISTFRTFPENLWKYIVYFKSYYRTKYKVIFKDFFSKYERNPFTFTKYIFNLKHYFMYSWFSVAICAVCFLIIPPRFFFNRPFSYFRYKNNGLWTNFMKKLASIFSKETQAARAITGASLKLN